MLCNSNSDPAYTLTSISAIPPCFSCPPASHIAKYLAPSESNNLIPGLPCLHWETLWQRLEQTASYQHCRLGLICNVNFHWMLEGMLVSCQLCSCSNKDAAWNRYESYIRMKCGWQLFTKQVSSICHSFNIASDLAPWHGTCNIPMENQREQRCYQVQRQG